MHALLLSTEQHVMHLVIYNNKIFRATFSMTVTLYIRAHKCMLVCKSVFELSIGNIIYGPTCTLIL